MKRLATLFAATLLSSAAQAGDTVSVEAGARMAVLGGCHDCHTEGYAESNGKIEPGKALAGSSVGFQGPWGTTYPANLKLSLATMSEEDFVDYGHTFEVRPPMPWFNVHPWTDDELKSFYRYVKSLGEPGPAAPAYVPPGGKPTSPFLVFAPPTMPAQ